MELPCRVALVYMQVQPNSLNMKVIFVSFRSQLARLGSAGPLHIYVEINGFARLTCPTINHLFLEFRESIFLNPHFIHLSVCRPSPCFSSNH